MTTLLPSAVSRHCSFGRTALLVALLGSALPLTAQPVFAPPPGAVPASPGMSAVRTPGADAQERSSTGTTVVGPGAPGEPRTTDVAGRPVFEWGPVALHPSITYRFTYGDGIQAQPGQQTTTAIHNISPSFLLNLGRLWAFTYAPTLNYYSSDRFNDTVDHSASLAGATTFENWTFRFSQSFASASPVLAETAQQTEQKNFGTDLGVSFAVGTRIALDFGVAQNLRFVDGTALAAGTNFSDTREWSTTDWFRYRFAPGLALGLGVGYGYTAVQASPDMEFNRVLAEVDWSATRQTSLRLQVGTEHRRFHGGTNGKMDNPILEGSLVHRPFPNTTLSFGATRSVSASYFSGEATRSTGLTAQLTQRLLGRFQFTVGLVQQRTNYIASAVGMTGARSDRNRSVDLRLSTAFRQQGTIAVSYRNGENSSNTPGFGFDTNQVGFDFGYRF